MSDPASTARWPSIGYGTLPLRRILVVQTQRMGDVLCLTPLLTALRRQFPSARIGALLHRPHEQLLVGTTDVDEVIVYDRLREHRSLAGRVRLIGQVADGRYDWALVIHAASSVAFALWRAGIPWRTCVWRLGDRRRPHWAWTYHQHIRQDREAGDRHEVERNLDVLRELGMEPDHSGYRYHVLRQERERARRLLAERGWREDLPLALVHPGHGGGRQAWPSERYAAVACGLRERGWQVGITGSDREAGLVREVAAGTGGEALDLAGAFLLREFAAALSFAGLFVSVSTGPMHLASAVGVPCVTLYGPTALRFEMTRFCPYGTPHRPVTSPIACTCDGFRTCPRPLCMEGILPEAVLQAADALVGVAP